MFSIRYTFTKYKIYTIDFDISPDLTIHDLIDSINKKHNKNFCHIFSKSGQEYFDLVDIYIDSIGNDQIFYLSETADKNLDDFSNKSDFQEGINMNDYKVIKRLPGTSKPYIYEVIHKTSKMKYYAEVSNEHPTYRSILPLIIHGSVTHYDGFSPNDFKNSIGFVLISKFYKNGSLEKLLNEEQNNKSFQFLDDTKRMIIIYGIASGMSYLQSIGIENNRLKSDNVFLDDYLFPKISFYGYQIMIKSKNNHNNKNKYTIDGDSDITITLDDDSIDNNQIFIFSLIVYEILMKKKPFSTNMFESLKEFYAKKRPPLEGIPQSYINLISKCWDEDPLNRLSFSEIVNLMKTDPGFIIEGADKNVYYDYIKLLDDYIDLFNEDQDRIISFEEFVSQKSNTFKMCKLLDDDKDDKSEFINNEENNNSDNDINSLNDEYLNLNDYSKAKLIGEGIYGQVFQVVSKKTKISYSAKISKMTIIDVDENKTNIYREAMIISRLYHPSILKFIGYSPKDFEGEKRPVILTEFSFNGSLDQLLELNRYGIDIFGWDDTKRLIIIYGLASCMNYLHSLNIIHRDLKIKNILLDQYLYPKLANFCFSTLPENYDNQRNQELMGNPLYYAPEIFERKEFSKSSDVYAFSFIVYEIITGKKPFEYDSIFQIITKVLNGERPSIDESIPKCFSELIQSCWSQEPSKRPTFSEIVLELRINKSFITNDVDEKEFQAYCDYVDEYPRYFSKLKKTLRIEDFINEDLLMKVDLRIVRKEHSEVLKSKINIKYTDLNKYEIQSKIGEGSFSYVYKIIDKKTNEIYAGKISKFEIYLLNESKIIDHYREVEIISKINHPCILRFIGYSPINFDHDECPIIITEFTSEGTLKNALNLEREGLSLNNWNNTTKLINIYGIAISMMYLHQLNILHRDLKPENILLDKFLHPKIADFGISKIISNEEDKFSSSSTYNQIKGTLIYCAPEILGSLKYSKAGDVYAFSLIVRRYISPIYI